MYSSTGWKLNPVVGAVYGPEFYAGKLHLSVVVTGPRSDTYFDSLFVRCALISRSNSETGASERHLRNDF